MKSSLPKTSRDRAGSTALCAIVRRWWVVICLPLILTGGALAQQVKLNKSSDPGGIVSGETWHESGTLLTVAAAPDASGSQKFCYWTLNGSRRVDAAGNSVNGFSFTILEDSSALAKYLPVAQDADADGVPDWYELRAFGNTEHPANHDLDGDGRGLAQEYLDGTNPRAAEFIYQESSEPAGIANRRVFLSAGSVVSTGTLPLESGEKRFVHWLLDGVRRETAVGVAASQLQVVMDANRHAVAVYVDAAADTDADGLPDWYEMFQYGTLEFAAGDDSDGDGRSLIDEYRLGAQPRIADTASSGGIVEGGIARRRGGLTALEFGDSRFRYEERSSPGGVLARVVYLEPGVSVSSGTAPAEVSGFRFVHWTVNGLRQTGADGLPPLQIAFALAGDTVAEAVYVSATQDEDADGVFDWYEIFHYGSVAPLPGSDTDGDGRTLLQEQALGLNPLRREWRFQQVSSPVGQVASRDQYLVDGTNVLTDNISVPPTAMEFGQWTLNGIRQETENGVALRSVRFNLGMDTVATAVFLPLSEDSDADGVPDWYEVRNYGDLAQAASSDTDGDGRSLADEYLLGTQPRIADSANDGLIVEGGIARRRGGMTTVVLSDGYRRYIESSSPGGIAARDAVLPLGSSITTAAAASSVGAHRFVHWLLDGARQEGADRLPIHQLTFSLDADRRAEMVYLDAAQDLDADGVLDWFETYHYGSASLAASSDTDGDGRTLAEEFVDGTQPKRKEWRYTERSQAGGVASRDEFLPDATAVTTPTAPVELPGLRFVHWLLNGQRQVTALGSPLSRLQLALDRTVIAEAVYLDTTLDADADGLPDWYEVFHFGDVAQGPQSDADGDGRPLMEEYQLGSQPLIADTAASGGIVEGGISRRRGMSLALNMQFFPVGQLAGADGQGIFTDPYGSGGQGFLMAGGSSAPAVGDVDGDGDVDLVVGGVGGAVKFLLNAGSPFGPQLVEVPVTLGQLPDWPTGQVFPALGDWNGDGLADLVVGSDDGKLRFYQAQAGQASMFVWVGDLTVGTGAVHPAFLPGSGGPDLLVLDGVTGLVSCYVRSTSTPPYAAPAAVSDLLGTPIESGTGLSVADVTADGILDVIASDSMGRLWRFNGSAGGSYTLVSKVWGGSFNGFRPGLSVAIVDLDGDGDRDIIGGGTDGALIYLKNPEKHLRISPAVVTVGVGETLDFSSIDDNGTLSWSMGLAESAGSIAPLTGLYVAGSTVGIEQVVARNAAGRTGVAWVNVVQRGGVNGLKWRALLVDGRRSTNDPVWPAAHALNTRAREVLMYRGMNDAQIEWLGHGENGPDAAPSRAALRSALRDGSTLASDTEVLMVYLVDHGRVAANGDGLFLLSENESVSGTELDGWLDALQGSRPNLSVVLVVESCFGGRVAGPMMAADGFSTRRLVMTSSGADQLAHLAAGGLVSYSTMWWSGVAAGKTLGQAHEDATGAMLSLQDGQRGAGGAALAAGKLGLGGVAGSGRPVVTVLENEIQLQGTQEARLAVAVESSFAVDKVWGVVVPPGYRASGDAPVVDLTEVELVRDAASGQWATVVGGFSEGGAPYTVLLQARDVWDQVSAPTLIRVHQASIRNRVIIFAHGEDGWSGAGVAGSLAAYAREVALLRRVREEDVRVIADAVFAEEGAAEASESNLQNAIETWANADGKLGALTVFAVGQGSQEGLVCANGDAVTPGNLQVWLDTLQDESGATAQLIVDSDYSGRFVAGSGSGNYRRVVVSSTAADRRNTFANGQWSNVTRWMWNAIARGRDLRESYGEATDLARMIGVTVPSLFDDNGDGNFTKLRDGLKAINAFVGSAYVTADDPPFIGSASALMRVASGQRARFWVSGIVMPDGAPPESVWYEVLGPDGVSCGTGSLWHNPTKDRHEGSFAGFPSPGTYLVFVQAGTKGDPARTTPPAVISVDYGVTVDHGAPVASGLPAIALPLDGRMMDVETEAGGEWRVALTRGQRLVIEARELSASRDVSLQLLGAGGRVLATADAWGPGFGENLAGWEVPLDGSYIVRASFATGSGAAECKVRAFIQRDAGPEGLVVLPAQALTFSVPAEHPHNSGPLNLVATASSGLPVRFEILSGPGTLTGAALTSSGAGTLVLRALQDGNSSWDSAEPVERSLQITDTAANSYEAWALEIFGADHATKGAPTQDADGDGQSNAAEWLARTHPQNAADSFEIASATRVAAGFRLRWLARQGVHYRITGSRNLVDWSELANSRVLGAGAEVEHTDPSGNDSRKFYRVEVIPP